MDPIQISCHRTTDHSPNGLEGLNVLRRLRQPQKDHRAPKYLYSSCLKILVVLDFDFYVNLQMDDDESRHT